MKIASLFLLALLCTGCLYKMPCEDEFSTVPLTNNPYVTQDPGSSPIPGMSNKKCGPGR